MSFRNLTSLLYSVEKHRKINVISMKFRAQMSLILCVLTLYLFISFLSVYFNSITSLTSLPYLQYAMLLYKVKL